MTGMDLGWQRPSHTAVSMDNTATSARCRRMWVTGGIEEGAVGSRTCLGSTIITVGPRSSAHAEGLI
jgi:hypothetical protein